ncbi:Pycsar system effector family protein [Ekhidna sp.]|uniref:Pycsar system effector family protein n=1 Tax=Ekhidna sp. TaxID=2608089 RepID=UPI003B5B80C9
MIISAVSLVSTFLIFTSIYPFLKTGNSEKSSLIFFKDVSERDLDSFKNEFQIQSNSDLEEDLIQQVYSLSQGLSAKFKKIRWAGFLCYSHLLVALTLIIQYLL